MFGVVFNTKQSRNIFTFLVFSDARGKERVVHFCCDCNK